MSRCLRCGADNAWIEPIGKEATTASLSRREEKYVGAIKKRVEHLHDRVERRESSKQDASYDRLEAAALVWALRLIGTG